jgi:Protein of unknown function (DUF3047)
MTTHVLGRRALLQAAAAVLLSRRRGWAAGAPRLVEDWSAAPVGTKGVPPGWQKYETPGGHPAYDFTVVEDAGRRALHMTSAGEHSTIAKEVQADLAATPILAWQWRVNSLPWGADLQNRATSDASGHIFAVWPRFPAFARSRLIGYVWDPALPVGTVIPSRKTSAVTFIVMRRGEPGLGRWVDEQRNVADDYRRLFGEPPPPLPALALSIDTNDTRAPAEALVGRIELRER